MRTELLDPERSRYLSYLLRLWQEHDQGAVVWRASLERPGTGERYGFADPEALFTFLRARLLAQSEEEDDF